MGPAGPSLSPSRVAGKSNDRVSTGARRDQAQKRRGRPAYLVVAVAVGAYAWWISGLEHFSAPAPLGVMAAAALAVGSAWWRPRRRAAGPSGHVGLGPWLVVLGALLTWELVAFSLSPRPTHPTLSSITDAALGPRPLEAAAFVIWLASGRRLARR